MEAATVVPADLYIQVRKFEREFTVIVQFACAKALDEHRADFSGKLNN